MSILGNNFEPITIDTIKERNFKLSETDNNRWVIELNEEDYNFSTFDANYEILIYIMYFVTPVNGHNFVFNIFERYSYKAPYKSVNKEYHTVNDVGELDAMIAHALSFANKLTNKEIKI